MEIQPLIIDEYPVNDDALSLNVYVRKGDGVATLAVTDKHSSYDPDEAQAELDAAGNDETAEPVNAVDGYLNEDDLYELAMSCARAIAALGNNGLLAQLTRDVADTLATALI